jgi:hypothetical protein
VKRVVENLDTTLGILQKVIQSIQIVPSGIKIGNEHLILAYADYILLIGKNEIEIKQIFVETESTARKNSLKQNKIECFKIINYKFERVAHLCRACYDNISLNSWQNEKYKENQNLYFMFNNFFLKIMPFMRKCQKIW